MASASDSSEEDDVPLALLLQLVDSESSDSESEGITLAQYVGSAYEMTNSPKDRVVQIDTMHGWSHEPGGDFPMFAPFTGECKLNVPVPDNPTPMDFFKMFFEESMWTEIVAQTNLYAQEKIAGIQLKPHSRIRHWVPVTVDELKIFMAISISFGLTQKPDLDLYWSTDPMLETPFYGKFMTRDRYQLILSNFHLAVNTPPEAEAEAAPPPDPLRKVRPFLNMIQTKFIDVYSPGRDVSFDEGTCPWKGRLKFKVYNPAKPNKFGIKLYQVSESLTGYIIGFDIYTGKTDYTDGSPGEYAELVGIDPEVNTTTKLVVGLLAKCGLLYEGRHVYMDNYYTSPLLFDELDARHTYACGTVRKNRKEVPKVFSQVKLKQGEVIFRRRDNLLALKWHDKRDIHMLSTIHQPLWKNLRKRGPRQVVPKPVMVLDYVKLMGGVDLSDQLAQYYSCLRKTVKWWRKLFFHLLQLLVINAYTLFTKFGNQKISHFGFMKSLVIALCEEGHRCPSPIRKRAGPDLPLRLKDRHFPTYIKPKPGAKRAKPCRDCYACNPKKKFRKGFKRHQTSFWCEDCGRALCVPDCFRAFHKYKDYKRHVRGDEVSSSSDSDE